MIPEFERARLLVDLPQHGLSAGAVGVVVHVFQAGAGYSLEFFTPAGETHAVATVPARQVIPLPAESRQPAPASLTPVSEGGENDPAVRRRQPHG